MSFARASDYEPQVQDKIIGLFVVIALVALLYLLLHRVFIDSYIGDWIRLQADMSKSYGITKGTIIELSGVTIGEVEQVTLQPDTRVALALRFNASYHPLLRQGSAFKVNSQLGIDTVLTGVRLELVPGQDEGLLQDQDHVNIVEPKSLEQLVDDLQLEQLAEQAKSIVVNLDALTTGLVSKQDRIAATLDNVEQITRHLNDVSAGLPELLAQVSNTTRRLESGLITMNKTVNEVTPQATDLVQTANASLHTLAGTLLALQPAIEQLPHLLESTDQSLQSVRYLSYQLSGHWLLGGETAKAAGQAWSQLPDNDLYAGDMQTAVSFGGVDRLMNVNRKETNETP